LGLALWAGTCTAQGRSGFLETESLPSYLRDRGAGMPLSITGTYVQNGQLLVYSFFEYYRDSNFEYSPKDYNYSVDSGYRGKYTATEQLLLLGYGISDRLAIEVEGAIIQAQLEKSRDDSSTLPAKFKQSGLGDVEGQIRLRWATETSRHPEIFSSFEAVTPTQDRGSLIGTTDWQFGLGSGVTRGFSWGTLTARAALGYARLDNSFDIDEFGLDYLKRLSPKWRVFATVEGAAGTDYSLIGEVQWHFCPKGYLKLNSGFGLTANATDWAPEVGVLFGL
jgi:hypothetical protein